MNEINTTELTRDQIINDPELRVKAIKWLEHLMPFIRPLLAEGKTVEEAIPIANYYFMDLIGEIYEGKTDRAKAAREYIFQKSCEIFEAQK